MCVWYTVYVVHPACGLHVQTSGAPKAPAPWDNDGEPTSGSEGTIRVNNLLRVVKELAGPLEPVQVGNRNTTVCQRFEVMNLMLNFK